MGERLGFRSTSFDSLRQQQTSPGLLGPSQWVMAADSFSSGNLWFYGLARTCRIDWLVQLLHCIDRSPEL